VENTVQHPRPSLTPGPNARLSFDACAGTNVGLVRTVNEDAVLDFSEIGLWAVADGVGGADAGDHASRLIVDTLGATPAPISGAGFLLGVRRSLEMVNRQLRIEATAGRRDRVIASTVVCLLFFERWFCCLWAGDSRLYRVRDGRIAQMTRDHSEVQLLVDHGVILGEEARRHPRANVITRAVGAEDVLQLEALEDMLRPGDAFLLCTDGLTKVVDDREIAAALSTLSPAETVRGLIQMTLDRGAPDNVSVAAIKTGPAWVD
jgi:serine/threonine protein phosphatase PrpC